MPIPLVKHGSKWKERERNKDGSWRRKRRSHLCPGAEGVKVVNAIIDRIKRNREVVQLILAKEFNERGEIMAQILDATAGNRTIWIVKNDSRVLFLDIEPDLSYKPDLLLDCSNTGFSDKSFHTIIFDPPHSFGRELGSSIYTTPSKKTYDEKYPQWRRPNGLPRYYGLDKFQTKTELLGFLNRAAKEFHRILVDDGILIVKWGNNHSSIDSILPLFDGFIEVMRTSRFHGKHSKGGVWVLLMKKNTSEFALERKEALP